jgi:hypothetical protein
VQAVLQGVPAFAGVEGDAGEERFADCVAQLPQASEVVARHASGCLDLECDDGTVVTFDDQVDLVPVVGAPVTHAGVPSIHDTSLRSSPTTKVSTRWPSSVSEVGSRRVSLSGVSRSSRSATPESRTCTLGAEDEREVKVLHQAASRWMRKFASIRQVKQGKRAARIEDLEGPKLKIPRGAT